MIRRYLEEIIKPGQQVNPLFTMLGIEVERIADGEAVLVLPPGPGLIQGAGVVAGGVLATLADEAMAHAVVGGLEDHQTTATVECSIRYLSPARPGVPLKARAEVVRRGRSVVFVEADVLGDGEKLLARASGSFFVTNGKPGPDAADSSSAV